MTTPTLQSITQTSNTIVLRFDQAMRSGDGNIVISDGDSQAYLSGGRLLNRIVGATDSRSVVLSEGFNVGGDDGQVSYSGNSVTITLSSPLKAGLSYSVTMHNDTLLGADGDSYGIANTTLARFSVAGGTPVATPAAAVGGTIHFIDTGDSSDYITSAVDQVVTGSYTGTLGANDFIQVSLDNGASWHKATASGNSWSYSGQIDTGHLIGDDSNDLHGALLARVSNTAGGGSGAVSRPYVLSSQSGSVEVYSDFIISDDTGSGDNDMLTRTAVQNFSGRYTGTLSGGQTIQVSVDGGSTWHNAVAGNGDWHADNLTLLDGSHEARVRVADGAGNGGNAVAREYTLDTSIASLDGHALNLAAGSDNGRSDSDNITSDVQQVSLNVAGLHGLHAGDTIVILDATSGGDPLGSYIIQSGDLYYGDDYFSVGPQIPGERETVDIDIGTRLGDGYHHLVAFLLDAAGNAGAYSGTVTVKVETQAYNSDTLTGNHFIETSTSLTGTLTASAPEISDQIVEVTLDHGATWQQATLARTDAKHANWSLAADLSTAIEYGVRIADPADNVTATTYYLTSREASYNHPGYNDIKLYAGGGIDYITVGDRAWIDGGGGYGDQIVTGADSVVTVGNDSRVTTGNGNNVVSTGFGANVTTGNGDDTIYCSTVDGVTIRAGLGNDSLTANTRVNELTVGGQFFDVRGVETLKFGFNGNNDLTINSAASVRTFSDSGTLTITAAYSGSHLHLNSTVWVEDNAHSGYHSYHASTGEILLIGLNITIDNAIASD
jgi:hypothetical protein